METCFFNFNFCRLTINAKSLLNVRFFWAIKWNWNSVFPFRSQQFCVFIQNPNRGFPKAPHTFENFKNFKVVEGISILRWIFLIDPLQNLATPNTIIVIKKSQFWTKLASLSKQIDFTLFVFQCSSLYMLIPTY